MAPALVSPTVRVLLYGEYRDRYAEALGQLPAIELIHFTEVLPLKRAIESGAGHAVVVCSDRLPDKALDAVHLPPVIWITDGNHTEAADVVLPQAATDAEVCECVELLSRRFQMLQELDRWTARIQQAFVTHSWRGQSRWHGHYELLAMAYSDSLTGLFSRRHFDRAFRHEVEMASASGRPLCLLLLDLDRFKPINDRWGHHAGDVVLVEVARRLKLCVRTTDVVCRYGGDEFAVIAPGTAVSAASRIANRLRSAISDTGYTHGTETVRLGCSIGIAPLISNRTEVADEIVRRADRALFAAKQLGGDRVSIGDPTDPL